MIIILGSSVQRIGFVWYNDDDKVPYLNPEIVGDVVAIVLDEIEDFHVIFNGEPIDSCRKYKISANLYELQAPALIDLGSVNVNDYITFEMIL